MPVPVETQCARRFFYSANDAGATETVFQQMEGAYGRIARKIWERRNPSERDYFGLILMMLDLHCRNPAFANLTGDENVTAYNAMIHCLRNHTLTNTPAGNVSDAQLLDHLRSVWKVCLLETTEDGELATSDNPSMWFTLDDDSGLHLVLLPVSPRFCAAAFDARYCHVTSGTLQKADQELLNQYQVFVSRECLFTSSQLSAEQQEAVHHRWRTRVNSPGEVHRERWVVNLLPLGQSTTFGFLRRTVA